MPIRLTTPLSKIDKYIAEQTKRQERAIVNVLAYIGTQCVNKARQYGSYTDRTGNLRSSIGDIVVVDGKVRSASDFQPVIGLEGRGEQGTTTGAEYAKKIVAQYPQGSVLIVVAGMHYASYVAAKGFDVLASAELEAHKLIPKLLKQLEIEITHANSKSSTD